MNDEGFITLHRKVMESWMWHVSASDLKLALTCLFSANWKPGKWFDGAKMVHIDRGSFVTSVGNLTEVCGKGYTYKKVRGGLARLERAEFLKLGKAQGQRWTMITIRNYSKYQDMQTDRGKVKGNERAMSGQSKGNERATIEQGNKGTREQETIARKRAQPIPKDWKPHEKHALRADELRLNCIDESEAYRNHALSKGRKLVDWDAGFFNWLKQSAKYQSERTGSRPHAPRLQRL